MKELIIQIVLIIYGSLWKLLAFLGPILPQDNRIGRWLAFHRAVNINAVNNNTSELILFTCSSVGEYKRIETLAHRYAQLGYAIEICFFSPSGYSFLNAEHQSWHRISLLPLDIKKDVALFLKARKPSYIVISSNMIWPNFIRGLDANHIRYSIVGCSFFPTSFLERLSANFRFSLIQNVEYAFCIDDNTRVLLSTYLTPDQKKVSGDPRLESIVNVRKRPKDMALLKKFKGNNKLIVLGSAYTAEVHIAIKSKDILKEAGYKVLIAPHELDHIKAMIAQLEIEKTPVGLYSKAEWNNDFLILDTIGMLSRAYGLAEIAFIGGGWNRGIHNIVEAIIYNCSIITGPKYHKFPEARFLAEQNVLTVLKESDSLALALSQEKSETIANKKIKCYQDWLELNQHANQIILDSINLSP